MRHTRREPVGPQVEVREARLPDHLLEPALAADHALALGLVVGEAETHVQVFKRRRLGVLLADGGHEVVEMADPGQLADQREHLVFERPGRDRILERIVPLLLQEHVEARPLE